MAKWGDTPRHSERSKCEDCVNAIRVKGDSLDKHMTWCRSISWEKPERITFKVIECNQHKMITEQSVEDMKRIAYVIEMGKGGQIGFLKPGKATEKDEIIGNSPEYKDPITRKVGDR